jgi:hypothetical protein
MVLPLDRVTAAEIVILRQVHGNDAVIRIKHIGERNVQDAVEFARLAKKFEGHKVEGGGNIVAMAFPGAAPILPQEVPPIPRSAEQRAVEDVKPMTKAQIEAGDELLSEPVALDSGEDDDSPLEFESDPPESDDVLLEEKAA